MGEELVAIQALLKYKSVSNARIFSIDSSNGIFEYDPLRLLVGENAAL